MHEHLITPSKSYYAFPAVVLVVGLAIGTFFVDLNDMGDSLPQYVVPGSHPTMLTQTGTYTIFYEHLSIVDGEVFATPREVPGLRLSVVSPSGTNLVLRRPAKVDKYSVGGRTGFAAVEFDARETGTYQISGSFIPGVQSQRIVIAVGHDFNVDVFGAVISILIIAFLTVAVTVALTLVIWRARKKSEELIALQFKKTTKK